MPDGIGFHDLLSFVGQTVTIFTSSGGLSGSGFTGILVSANDCFVRIIASIGPAPDCPVGSTCGYPTGGYGGGFGGGYGGGYGGGCGSGRGGYGGYGRSGLGSVVVIPVDKIVSFTHNAI